MVKVASVPSIPGRETLRSPEIEIQYVLRTLCANAKYRVAMDADVSADGAVRDWLRVVVPQLDVMHVQLRRAALHRELHYGCTDSKRDVEVMQLRLKLALERARKSRVDAMAGGAGTMLKQAALRVIGSQLRPARRRRRRHRRGAEEDADTGETGKGVKLGGDAELILTPSERPYRPNRVRRSKVFLSRIRKRQLA